MAEPMAPEAAAPIVCPHCKKPFEAELLAGPAMRYRGFKCPHCRLFVPSERAAQVSQPTHP
jgi:DNA-directed RNA polymerase subunit RPC12/RpoP